MERLLAPLYVVELVQTDLATLHWQTYWQCRTTTLLHYSNRLLGLFLPYIRSHIYTWLLDWHLPRESSYTRSMALYLC